MGASRDYTALMNAIQVVTTRITAITSQGMMFSKLASVLEEESKPSSSAKTAQKIVKTVQKHC